MHTSYAVSADGEPIVLTDPEGQTIHRVPPIPLDGDVSYGFYPEDLELTLSVDDPELRIYYTLDGSEPDPAALDGRSYFYKNSYPNGGFVRGQQQNVFVHRANQHQRQIGGAL